MIYIPIAAHIFADYPRVCGLSEYQVFLQLLYRSMIARNPEITISHLDLQRTLDLSHVTIRKSIRELLKKGFIRIVRGHFKKEPTTYFVVRNTYDSASNHPGWDITSAFPFKSSPSGSLIARQEMEQKLWDFFFSEWKEQLAPLEVERIYAHARQNCGGLNHEMFSVFFDAFIWDELIAKKSDRELLTLCEFHDKNQNLRR